MKKGISGFPLGFISEYDFSRDKPPDGSLSDCLNMEINTPHLAIKNSLGYDTEVALPPYSGNRNVAFHRWSVDNPSDKELITLIRASDNLLKFSEDFEIDNFWIPVAGGAIHDANFGSISGTRKSDRLTNTSNTTRFHQLFSGVVGTTYTFSLYFKKSNSKQIRISISDTDLEDLITSATSVDSSGTLQRLTVTRTLATPTGPKVIIDFPDSTGAETFEIWGAQLEVGSIATGYGPTFLTNKPYYIFLRPYWDGSSWVDNWRELTEQVSGVVDATLADQRFDMSTVIEPNNYFNNWRVYCPVEAINSKIPLFVYAYTGSLGRFQTFRTRQIISAYLNLAPGVRVGIYRFISQYESPFLNQDSGIDESDITFLEVTGGLRISFGNTHRPLIIKYVKTTNALHNTSSDIVYNEFILSNNTFTAEDISTKITTAPAVATSERVAFLQRARTSTGGTLPSGIYYLSIVGVVDGEKFAINMGTSFSLGANSGFFQVIGIEEGNFNPRLQRIEFYLGNQNNDWSKVLVGTIPIDSSAITWPRNGTLFYLLERTITISAIDFTQPTLLQSLGRASVIETRNRFNIQRYLRGRIFTAGISESNSSDKVRFSHIRTGVEEPDIFPYSADEGYGFIVADAGTSEGIVGYSSTRDSDLLVFKDKSTLLYEVQSGAFTKRLVRLFDGIGCGAKRGIVESDYGTFWYDSNGAYNYLGGITAPNRISDNKITQYIKNVLAPYIPSSFAIFNRKLDEYWWFINNKVLRYSPKYGNWNILQFPFVPLWVSEKLNGEMLIVSATSNVFKYGYNAVPLTNGFIETQRLTYDDISTPKEVVDIDAEYVADSNFTIATKVNSESVVREGNNPVFFATRKHMSRQPRQGSTFNKVRFKVSKGNGNFELTTFTPNVVSGKDRYGK